MITIKYKGKKNFAFLFELNPTKTSWKKGIRLNNEKCAEKIEHVR
jgi:hypothetical protein